MDFTLKVFFVKSPAFVSKVVFFQLALIVGFYFWGPSCLHSASPQLSETSKPDTGAIRMEPLKDPMPNISRKPSQISHSSSALVPKKVGLLSATPVPYEGRIVLKEFSTLPQKNLLSNQTSAVQHSSLPSSASKILDCQQCQNRCSKDPQPINFTPFQVAQVIEKAENPSLRRALLLALRQKDMALFSNLVILYDLLNSQGSSIDQWG